LEVVVGLALLAGLGVWLVQSQADALRQYRRAEQRQRIAAQVEQLLWTWSVSGAPVTLPATGHLSDGLSWRREVRPVRLAAGVLPTQVSLIVTAVGDDRRPQDVYRVDWLVPQPRDNQEPR
jgi:hypothetical protein